MMNYMIGLRTCTNKDTYDILIEEMLNKLD